MRDTVWDRVSRSVRKTSITIRYDQCMVPMWGTLSNSEAVLALEHTEPEEQSYRLAVKSGRRPLPSDGRSLALRSLAKAHR